MPRHLDPNQMSIPQRLLFAKQKRAKCVRDEKKLEKQFNDIVSKETGYWTEEESSFYDNYYHLIVIPSRMWYVWTSYIDRQEDQPNVKLDFPNEPEEKAKIVADVKQEYNRLLH